MPMSWKQLKRKSISSYAPTTNGSDSTTTTDYSSQPSPPTTLTTPPPSSFTPPPPPTDEDDNEDSEMLVAIPMRQWSGHGHHDKLMHEQPQDRYDHPVGTSQSAALATTPLQRSPTKPIGAREQKKTRRRSLLASITLPFNSNPLSRTNTTTTTPSEEISQLQAASMSRTNSLGLPSQARAAVPPLPLSPSKSQRMQSVAQPSAITIPNLDKLPSSPIVRSPSSRRKPVPPLYPTTTTTTTGEPSSPTSNLSSPTDDSFLALSNPSTNNSTAASTPSVKKIDEMAERPDTTWRDTVGPLPHHLVQ